MYFAAEIKSNTLGHEVTTFHAFKTQDQREAFTLERFTDSQRLAMVQSNFLERYVYANYGKLIKVAPGHVAGICDPDWLRYTPA